MRLLCVDSLEFAVHKDASKRPKYVIASHRWFDDAEATFKDVRKGQNTKKRGYAKIEAFAQYIKDNIPSVKWLWIDTCCINKDSAAELSEAINSMFEWYRDAELCLAYLADVETPEDQSAFGKSKWFTRGWTLQELLAPQAVVFVTKEWQVIGHKGRPVCGDYPLFAGSDLVEKIARVTGIPEPVLQDYNVSLGLSVEERLKWMEGRETTLPEDKSYALYGILGVTPGANYGEKYEGARQRLLTAIDQRDNFAAQQAEHYRRITDWLSPPDPWTNHESARQRHEPQTGIWLIQHNQYLEWKLGSCRALWVYGKAGCGKTILCFTAIEDIRTYCQHAPDTGHAIFYFSFSDNRKQTYQNLVVSLVVQLGKIGPGRSMLHQAYEKAERRQPGLDELQKILLVSIASYDKIFLHLDALDECPEEEGARQKVLDGVQMLLEQAPNVRMLITSRDVPDARYFMEKLGANILSIGAQTVNADIQRYVSTELSRDRRLSQLDQATRTFIEDTLAQKADGMFRWVYCQLQVLKASKSTRPSSIKAALRALPKDLDETYQRMLSNINENDRPYALTLLRWLAYAQSPPSLDQLAEAGIVDPTDNTAANGFVNVEDRGGYQDALEILAGLVIIEGADEGNIDDDNWEQAAPDIDEVKTLTYTNQQIGKETKIRLAHFSVKEYLESSRILTGEVDFFHLDPLREHWFLAQSCLVYLIHYSRSSQKTSTVHDLTAFPLLEYAAKSWTYHGSIGQRGNGHREVSLLTSEDLKRTWLLVYKPDNPWRPAFQDIEEVGSSLYYASFVGLDRVVQKLLDAGAEVTAQGGEYGNALQAASLRGHEKVVQMLLDAGAEVTAQGGQYGNALQAASFEGHEKVVQMLLDAGAEVTAQGGQYGNALQAASFEGHEKVVQMLLDAGAEVTAQGGHFGNALQAASLRGHEKVVQMLLDAGAEVTAQGGEYGNALQAASFGGHEKVVQMLLDVGAEVNLRGGRCKTSLLASSLAQKEAVVQLLLDKGADFSPLGAYFVISDQTGSIKDNAYRTRVLLDRGADLNGLHDALRRGEEEEAQLFLTKGVDVNSPGRDYNSAVEAACIGGEAMVQFLLGKGDVDADIKDFLGRTPLWLAASRGAEAVVRVLLLAGKVDVNARANSRRSPLWWASANGHLPIVKLLLDTGQIDTKLTDTDGHTALWAAEKNGHKEVVQLLLDTCEYKQLA